MSEVPAIVASVVVKEHSENACAIFLGEKRVGYVGYGSPAPISWLPEKCTGGIKLDTTERIAIVKQVRVLAAELAKKRDEEREELRQLENDAAVADQGQEPDNAVEEDPSPRKKTARKKPTPKS